MPLKVPLKRTTKKLLSQLRSNPSDLDDNDDPVGPDELDLQSPYRRPELVKNKDVDDDVSDHVKTRLLIARLRALEKHRNKWA